LTLSFSQRGPMQPLAARIRAYFAPVARDTSTPTIFDPAKDDSFALDSPPAPWLDAGWISNFTRTADTKFVPLRVGAKNAARLQCRRGLGATIGFEMHDWGKLQMAISSGSQHMNLLAEEANTTPEPSGGVPLAPVALLAGSTAGQLVVGSGAVDSFNIGDLVAVDIDYAQQTGYVGTGIAGAFVKAAADVGFDPNYIRRVTFNVGRISGKTQTSLQLAQPLLAGPPPVNAQIQKVVGFVDREGGSFFQEWSALFVCESETGARAFYYYPRVQPAAPAHESSSVIAGAFDAWSLHAKLIALPTTDLADGEQVLCYRSFIPAQNAALY
jgi:hypothetical protein